MGTQCVPIWVCLVKLSAKLKLTVAESTSIFRILTFCKILQNVCTIVSTFFPLLLLLKNALAQLPIHMHSAEVNTPYGVGSCRLYYLTRFTVQRIYLRFCYIAHFSLVDYNDHAEISSFPYANLLLITPIINIYLLVVIHIDKRYTENKTQQLHLASYENLHIFLFTLAH